MKSPTQSRIDGIPRLWTGRIWILTIFVVLCTLGSVLSYWRNVNVGRTAADSTERNLFFRSGWIEIYYVYYDPPIKKATTAEWSWGSDRSFAPPIDDPYYFHETFSNLFYQSGNYRKDALVDREGWHYRLHTVHRLSMLMLLIPLWIWFGIAFFRNLARKVRYKAARFPMEAVNLVEPPHPDAK